jgi:Xaa-Pro dipeptidase
MEKLNLFVLEKLKAELAESAYEAILVFGADHVQYLSGAALPSMFSNKSEPVYFFMAQEAEPVLVCPAKLKNTLLQLGWVKKIVSYQPAQNPLLPAENLLEGIKHVGMDFERLSVAVYEDLVKALPALQISACDTWLKGLRMIKMTGELQLLAHLAATTDHGIAGAIHHVPVLGARSEKYIAEDIRVHCIERELDCQGYHSLSLAASGEHSQKIWPLAPSFGMGWAKTLNPGDTVRLEMRSVHHGYWCDAARMLTMGTPDDSQNDAYQSLAVLRDAFEAALLPGVKANALYQKLIQISDENNIRLVEALGVGHGVGVTPYEGPFLNAWDETVLSSGMVVVLDIMVQASNQDLFRIRETYQLTASGFTRADWYQSWDQPYIPAYTF